jgi:hypothetical protein
VAAESATLRLQLDADARLAAAVGGVARYLADAAGLKNEAIYQLQSAIVAACCEAFDHLSGAHPHLKVSVTRFADRIEVALSHPGEISPAVGLDAIAGLASPLEGCRAAPGVFAGVDRVQYEMHGGEAVTRLTKYLGQLAPGV